MKRAYIRVKPKSAKRATGKAYIVATVLSATVCAFVFSFLFSPKDDVSKEIKIDVPNVTPEEIAQVSEPVEIEVPITKEIEKEPKVEVAEPEKVQETGIFTNEEIKISKPKDGEVLIGFSGGKPVKSETMGDWRVHSGIDILGALGDKVKAPFKGEVISAENNKLTGNTVVIDHKNGYVSTLYNLQNISVSKGEKVEEGQVIGTVGNSAPLEAALAPHVHFEMKKDGKFVDPNNYIK